MGIQAVQQWRYCRKEEKEGSVVASKDKDRGQKVWKRRADEDSVSILAAMGMIFG